MKIRNRTVADRVAHPPEEKKLLKMSGFNFRVWTLNSMREPEKHIPTNSFYFAFNLDLYLCQRCEFWEFSNWQVLRKNEFLGLIQI